MIAFLEPLSRLPGVEFVMLISHDGVPIAQVGAAGGSGREDSLAALAASWLNEISQAVAPLSWNPPARAYLRAGRGTLVVRRSESACLVALLGRETTPEDVRLSMDGALARIERARQGRSRADRSSGSTPTSEPTGPIPYRKGPEAVEEGVNEGQHPGHAPGN